MKPKSKHISIAGISIVLLFFIFSFLLGSILVKKSEKEFNPKKQKGEAEASKYSLQEIDAKTGLVRWKLTAKKGTTKNNLKSAVIKDIEAKVYKNKELIFELKAPYGKANSTTKEVLLYGGVKTLNKQGDFLLSSNQLSLGMGTSIEAQKGFNLTIKNKGNLKGKSALVNEDQTKIEIQDLKEASLKDIVLKGKLVSIHRDDKGNIIKASIYNNGTITFKKHNDSKLSADIIEWKKEDIVEAKSHVIYKSNDVTFNSDYLQIKPSGELIANTNVKIIHGETTCYGDFLIADGSQIIIQGNPKAIQNGKQISADKIVYDLKTEKVEAIGNVKSTISDKV